MASKECPFCKKATVGYRIEDPPEKRQKYCNKCNKLLKEIDITEKRLILLKAKLKDRRRV